MISNFFKKVSRIWSISTLRDRVFYTLLMFLVVRIGTHIPLPGVDLIQLKNIARGGVVDFINLVSGGAFLRASIFALSIVPYINASIIVYVLSLIYPKLDEMRKDGGKRAEQVTQWTRYLAIAISIVHSIGAVALLTSNNLVQNPGFLFTLNTVIILTTGVVFLTWIGDQITTNGIGNGISLVIFLGIVARIPSSVIQIFRSAPSINILVLEVIGISVLGLLLIYAIVAFQLAVCKVSVFYTSGRGNSIATKSFLPIRINNAGVMPIIFASIIVSIPSMVINVLPDSLGFKINLQQYLSTDSIFYIFLYFITVLFFTFFYTAVVFDPEKISDNLKKSGASIPGVRPGKETESYLEGVITKITLGGALFLAVISVLPFILSKILGSAFSMGGTGIIIAVGVAIETIQQIEGALSMEDYGKFI